MRCQVEQSAGGVGFREPVGDDEGGIPRTVPQAVLGQERGVERV